MLKEIFLNHDKEGELLLISYEISQKSMNHENGVKDKRHVAD